MVPTRKLKLSHVRPEMNLSKASIHYVTLDDLNILQFQTVTTGMLLFLVASLS